MVLTAEELYTTESSAKEILRSNVEQRQRARTLVEQCCIDRRIQVLLAKGGSSPVFQFNAYIVRNANIFLDIGSSQEPGWNCYGPTDPALKRLIDIKFRPSKHSEAGIKDWSLLRKERKRILQELNEVVSQELQLGDFEGLREEWH